MEGERRGGGREPGRIGMGGYGRLEKRGGKQVSQGGRNQEILREKLQHYVLPFPMEKELRDKSY